MDNETKYGTLINRRMTLKVSYLKCDERASFRVMNIIIIISVIIISVIIIIIIISIIIIIIIIIISVITATISHSLSKGVLRILEHYFLFLISSSSKSNLFIISLNLYSLSFYSAICILIHFLGTYVRETLCV